MKVLEILEKELKTCWELYVIGHKNQSDIDILEEAIKELQELENRSCSNCKHYKFYPTTKEMFCNNEKTKIGFNS